MKLVADENVDAAIVHWLRTAGYDVQWAAEMQSGCSDDVLIEFARREDRILLTSDLDFGELVYRRGLISTGVILLRIRAANQDDRLRILVRHWPEIERRSLGHFVVVGNRRLRVRPLPTF